MDNGVSSHLVPAIKGERGARDGAASKLQSSSSSSSSSGGWDVIVAHLLGVDHIGDC